MQPSHSRILVVFDGSSLGRRTLAHALDLARERGAGITVLTVVPPRLWRAKRAQFDIPFESRDREFAQGLLAEAKQMCDAQGVAAVTCIRTGPPVDVISGELSQGYATLVMPDRENPSGSKTLGERVRDAGGAEVVLIR